MTAEPAPDSLIGQPISPQLAQLVRNVELLAQAWADPGEVAGAWGGDGADPADIATDLVQAWASFSAWPPGDFEASGPLQLENCTDETPQCPHYACPDGWHRGDAPNCSCTPDCADLDGDD